VVFWTVAPKALRSHLELLGAVAKRHEAEDPEKNADGLS
jgi:hypothetical protein